MLLYVHKTKSIHKIIMVTVILLIKHRLVTALVSLYIPVIKIGIKILVEEMFTPIIICEQISCILIQKCNIRKTALAIVETGSASLTRMTH